MLLSDHSEFNIGCFTSFYTMFHSLAIALSPFMTWDRHSLFNHVVVLHNLLRLLR